VLLLTVHHIISDLWSWEIFMGELETFYAAERRLTEGPPPSPTIQYTDYVRWQNEMLSGPEGERLLDYWRTQLEDAPTVLNLAADRPRPREQSLRGNSLNFEVSETLLQELRDLAKNQGATLYTTLLTAFQILLYRYTQQNDLLIGSLTAGRSRAELSSVVGYFVNPVVLRTLISDELTFTELLKQSHETVLLALAHQNCPFSLLVERFQPNRSSSYSPFFQVMFILQQPHYLKEVAPFVLGEPGAKMNFGELAVESVPLNLMASQFDLTLMMIESDEVLAGSLEYSTDLFERSTIERMAGHYRQLLESIAAEPTAEVTKLRLLTRAEEQAVVESWNQTQREYRSAVCLHELFEQQVGRSPGAVALAYESEELTYSELNERANQLAQLLRKLGAGAETLIGVMMERSVEMVVALLGILKAGGAYVPLEPTYPEERLRVMIGDSGLRLLLTQSGMREAAAAAVGESGAEVIALEEVSEELSAASEGESEGGRVAEADNVAYVIYTSGSTGRPKGVQITHRGICNRLYWMQEAYGLTAADRVLQKTPYSFDVSVWEFFWPLMSGARLVLARPGGHQDSEYLRGLIEAEGITTLHFVPSMLRAFLESRKSWRSESLRRVICSGEALPVELQQRFFAGLDVELHNLYGPTEASVDVTFWQCRPEEESHIVPIGGPIANTQIYILDKHHNVVPVGVAGELFIGGVGLARGYLDQPSLTAARFIPNPFNGVFGERLYATGDLARYRPDGNVEFLGRLDYQVKIRGFRIELPEIETALGRHPLVQDVVVTAYEDEPAEHYLVAYVVSSPETALNASTLRRFVQETLPDYMTPRVFVFMEALPLSPNGKVDRKRLPAPDNSRPDVETGLVLPRSPLEETLAEIWSDVLKIEKVGVHDNFFELGGYSLLGTRVLSRLHNIFQVELPLSVIFEAPTIAELAVAVAQAQLETNQTDEITHLLEELERLPDEEAKRLLDSRQP
jgi:amino acid adenylation domain-containing protein